MTAILLTLVQRKSSLFCLTMTASVLLLIGCTKSPSDTSTTPPPATAPSAAATVADTGAGKTVFTAKCAGCHSVGGVGGKRGPDLSHTGAEADHTTEWLAAYISDPKSKDPGSKMPPFKGRITDPELQSVSAYLASQK